MAIVKLATARTRGAQDFAIGDLYECSDAEAQVLIEAGYATSEKAAKAEAEAEAEPEAEEAADEQTAPTKPAARPKR